jgi:hypothetical protein
LTCLGNLAVGCLDQLAVVVRSRLRRIQHRPDLATGFPARPGLMPESERLQRPDLGLSTPVAGFRVTVSASGTRRNPLLALADTQDRIAAGV